MSHQKYLKDAILNDAPLSIIELILNQIIDINQCEQNYPDDDNFVHPLIVLSILCPKNEYAYGTLDLLIKKGANVNVTDSRLNTPLMGFAYTLDIRCVELLLKNGAIPGLMNDEGKTAFSYAKRENGCYCYAANLIVSMLSKYEDKEKAFYEHNIFQHMNDGLKLDLVDIVFRYSNFDRKELIKVLVWILSKDLDNYKSSIINYLSTQFDINIKICKDEIDTYIGTNKVNVPFLSYLIDNDYEIDFEKVNVEDSDYKHLADLLKKYIVKKNNTLKGEQTIKNQTKNPDNMQQSTQLLLNDQNDLNGTENHSSVDILSKPDNYLKIIEDLQNENSKLKNVIKGNEELINSKLY